MIYICFILFNLVNIRLSIWELKAWFYLTLNVLDIVLIFKSKISLYKSIINTINFLEQHHKLQKKLFTWLNISSLNFAIEWKMCPIYNILLTENAKIIIIIIIFCLFVLLTREFHELPLTKCADYWYTIRFSAAINENEKTISTSYN